MTQSADIDALVQQVADILWQARLSAPSRHDYATDEEYRQSVARRIVTEVSERNGAA